MINLSRAQPADRFTPPAALAAAIRGRHRGVREIVYLEGGPVACFEVAGGRQYKVPVERDRRGGWLVGEPVQTWPPKAMAVPSWPRFAAAAPEVSVSDQDYVPIAPSRLVPKDPIDPRSGDDDWMPTDERMRAMVAADPTRTDDADFVAPPADRFAAGR